ncbi:hypothetical protein ABZ438_20135 [Streptomyces sp. NPDC005786]|uniref:hypothetical protein n=1 Tax=unclassified Streptomyces TaxID=2593676 RepID=UPI0033D023C2
MALHRIAAATIEPAAACADAGGEAARVDQTALVGDWTNHGGARLHLGADRGVKGQDLHHALLGGTTQCPDATTGHWQFFSSPNENGSSFADDALTSGDHVALGIEGTNEPCLLSALVRRDVQGLNLCLVEDPDSGCSAGELLRLEPGAPAGRALN